MYTGVAITLHIVISEVHHCKIVCLDVIVFAFGLIISMNSTWNYTSSPLLPNTYLAKDFGDSIGQNSFFLLLFLTIYSLSWVLFVFYKNMKKFYISSCKIKLTEYERNEMVIIE